MNWTITLIESGVCCLLFTILVLVLRKNVNFAALNYPPKIVERLIKLGKIKEETPLPLGKRLLKKLPILIIYAAGFTGLLYFVNGCRTFLEGFLTCFVIMSIWDWYDTFFLDCVLFCHTKLFVLDGTEDMTSDYHDYMFHIKGSLRGMILVILGSLMIGSIINIMSSL